VPQRHRLRPRERREAPRGLRGLTPEDRCNEEERKKGGLSGRPVAVVRNVGYCFVTVTVVVATFPAGSNACAVSVDVPPEVLLRFHHLPPVDPVLQL